jgi:hypothetical protein
MGLVDRIGDGSGEFLLFALTPPRLSSAGDRAQEIADATVARLRPLDLDGLVLYDIADEAVRNPAQRPFPFMPTLDPADFLANNLRSWSVPAIVYARSASIHLRSFGLGSRSKIRRECWQCLSGLLARAPSRRRRWRRLKR